MTFEVRVPSLGESVTEGVIVRWVKGEGDSVALDETLLELETDKATVEIPVEHAGVLHILRQQGETVEVGAVIARIEEGGAVRSAGPTAAVPTSEISAPLVPEGQSPPADSPAAEAPSPRPAARGVGPLSPAVRRLIEEHALDPTAIPASGKGGRLTKGDVLAFLEREDRPPTGTAAPARPPAPVRMPTPTPVPTPAGRPTAVAKGNEERVAMSPIRRRIAERLVQAQHTAAILTTFNEIDMSAVMALRARHKDRFREVHGVGLGFMSFFGRACVRALGEFPAINAEIQGDDIVYKRFVHLGIAVGTKRGLVVPVVRHAERKSFAEIEREIERLALLARDGKLSIDDLSDGTFTISNGGVYGSLLSTPILNPPQSGILGMHKIEKRPVVIDDEVVVRPMMYVALSYDHRIVDGEQAVTFLVRVKQGLEDPTRLLLDI
jgi:2-oxoglutarate dehydrogenase E2 component (dihydrolipoamide succinyltransferase)